MSGIEWWSTWPQARVDLEGRLPLATLAQLDAVAQFARPYAASAEHHRALHVLQVLTAGGVTDADVLTAGLVLDLVRADACSIQEVRRQFGGAVTMILVALAQSSRTWPTPALARPDRRLTRRLLRRGPGHQPRPAPGLPRLGRVSKSASLLHGQRPCPAARTGSALKSFRPCSPRPVRSRDCFHCWEPMRFACGLPGSSQAESRFRYGMSYQ